MLSDSLREGTVDVHRRAERTGIVSDMLADRVSRAGYQLYLRNLYEVYAALEEIGERAEAEPWAAHLLESRLRRAPSIANDLTHLGGADWRSRLPVLESAVDYRARINRLAEQGCSAGLVAHAYVRYMGDLSGGQMLARMLARHPALSDEQLSFYRFEEIDSADAAKRRFRRALDEFGTITPSPRRVVDEAKRAFEYNIELSREAKTRAGLSGGSML